MLEDMLYNKFLKLSDNKKIDYLYTALVEQDEDKLQDKYGPTELRISIEDDMVFIEAPTLRDARVVRDNMIMGGMILVDEEYTKITKSRIVATYLFEGEVQPICLN